MEDKEPNREENSFLENLLPSNIISEVDTKEEKDASQSKVPNKNQVKYKI